MKKMICFSLAAFLVLTGCRKNYIICDNHTELTGHNHLKNISALSGAQELLDSLERNPQMQVYRILDDQYIIGMHCHVFFNGLISFSDNYMVAKSKANNSIYCANTVTEIPVFSFVPDIPYTEAISIARQNMDYGSNCISYQLGLYDINYNVSIQPRNYKLVWKIQSSDGDYPYVILDAKNGQVYSKDNGWRE